MYILYSNNYFENDCGSIVHLYPGNTKSKVWDFFEFYKIKEGPPKKTTLDMTVSISKLCKKKILQQRFVQ